MNVRRSGSLVDAFEPQIRVLLAATPTMPATVIAERIGWDSISVGAAGQGGAAAAVVSRRRTRPTGPTYQPGEIVQCDLWFPPKVVPVAAEVLGGAAGVDDGGGVVGVHRGGVAAVPADRGPAGGYVAAAGGQLRGGAADAGVGQRGRVSGSTAPDGGGAGVRGHVGHPDLAGPARGIRRAKGVVERANGFLQTSFLPGREFASPADFNTQLDGWLPRANERLLRRTGARPVDRLACGPAAMTGLPPVPPRVGWTDRVRLGRDYYVRVAGQRLLGRPRDRPVRRRPLRPDHGAVSCAGAGRRPCPLLGPATHDHRPGPRRDREAAAGGLSEPATAPRRATTVGAWTSGRGCGR